MVGIIAGIIVLYLLLSIRVLRQYERGVIFLLGTVRTRLTADFGYDLRPQRALDPSGLTASGTVHILELRAKGSSSALHPARLNHEGLFRKSMMRLRAYSSGRGHWFSCYAIRIIGIPATDQRCRTSRTSRPVHKTA